MDHFICDDLKKANPNFSRLVDRLQSKLKIDKDSQLKHEHEKAKFEWLLQQVLYLAVKVVLQKSEEKCEKQQYSDESIKACRAVSSSLNMAECRSYLNQDSNQSLLGIDDGILERLIDDQKYLDEGKKMLHTEVEKYLELLCISITEHHDGINVSDNPNIVKARSLRLGEVVHVEKKDLAENHLTLIETQREQVNLYITYHQVLQDSVDILTSLITKYRLHLQPQKDQVLIKNSIVSCETFAAKLKSTRMGLKCETYTPDSIAALEKIRTELLTTAELRQHELADVTRQLGEYAKLGAEFEGVVRQYADTSALIEKQSWTLGEIKKQSGQDERADL